ncbi:hypothetical protein [Burkholderia glumae]|uniref:Uncharacterized protein n=1 Tax=Burkholderia glumae TaxID=337 RepID=A0AAP9XZS8_BURGL|nr:hypothetical protein [Burkholderia glumae]AJY64382.1 hypothetical protein KS03_4169 [Burkholderia glumae LMG 2196 = ATCC 33617]KHJ61409.1 hypothetical protein NCPPB3923_18930 [Burkholderia glumae]MCM2484722.1 hypothetical protein [Burkholderia glumae]MCM2495105.1 hypothetical protein [Burkholderia glumae]MCM2510415.1 hypothetical protein [Burkholderia glumae]
MQDILLLIAASIGFAIAALTAGLWFAGRQARRNPYSRHALVRQTVPLDGRDSRGDAASDALRAAHSGAAVSAAAAEGAVSHAAGANDELAAPAMRVVVAGAASAALRDAQAAARAAIRDARDADADAVDLEQRAAQAVRNAQPNVPGSEALALRLQDRARRARRYATLASQWAADARNYAELAAGEAAGSHAALAIERAVQAAGARREAQRLAAQRLGRIRGLQTAER